jgi:NAD(P)-dependent dehydrogenase (short-subunit alcohol dehydrogenase family)
MHLRYLVASMRPCRGSSAYAESKLCDVLLAFAVARRWKDVKANALEPGWVATKTGGPSAPDDLHQGCVTQAWLATGEGELAQSIRGRQNVGREHIDTLGTPGSISTRPSR